MLRLKKIGTVKMKNSADIKYSRCGLGFEKLDRGVFDPELAYDKVAALGVKWIRIQSGWERTEKEKGVYDYEWLDSIVDNLISRGLKPWLCLCYGNGLYGQGAELVFGAVGCPPIFSDEQKAAWAKYVETTVARYKDKISHYEIWNEPDGPWCWKHGVNVEEYAQFVIDTSKAIRRGFADAYILGGSLCLRNMHYFNQLFKLGVGDYINAITYHEYTPDEDLAFERVRSMRALIDRYNPSIKIIQGESGSQTKYGARGAMWGCNWTPARQARQLARHSMVDLMTEVEFFSYFSTVDMAEATRGVVGDASTIKDFGYFGVLGAEFDENGRSTGVFTPKPSYRTLGTIAAMFSEDCKPCDLPTLFRPNGAPPTNKFYSFEDEVKMKDLTYGSFKKDNGSLAFVYWNPTNLLSKTYEGITTVQIACIGNMKARLVNILDGSVYEIPDSMIEVHDAEGDCKTFVDIPLTDYPLALTFGDFIDEIEP